MLRSLIELQGSAPGHMPIGIGDLHLMARPRAVTLPFPCRGMRGQSACNSPRPARAGPGHRASQRRSHIFDQSNTFCAGTAVRRIKSLLSTPILLNKGNRRQMGCAELMCMLHQTEHSAALPTSIWCAFWDARVWRGPRPAAHSACGGARVRGKR